MFFGFFANDFYDGFLIGYISQGQKRCKAIHFTQQNAFDIAAGMFVVLPEICSR